MKKSVLQLRPFAPDSFWNQPVSPSARTDPRNGHFLGLLEKYGAGRNLHLNLHEWTMPVYEAAPGTPRRPVRKKMGECPYAYDFVEPTRPYLHPGHPFGHHVSTAGGIPIPDEAAPDAREDAHLVILDRPGNRGYDIWQGGRDSAGNWAANSCISYALDGPGVFRPRRICPAQRRKRAFLRSLPRLGHAGHRGTDHAP